MVRLTLNLPDDLYLQLKTLAAQDPTAPSLNDVLRQAAYAWVQPSPQSVDPSVSIGIQLLFTMRILTAITGEKQNAGVLLSEVLKGMKTRQASISQQLVEHGFVGQSHNSFDQLNGHYKQG